jgi:hypothetical protein
VLCEHAAAEGVDLAEGDRSHSGSLKPNTEASYPAEQVKYAQRSVPTVP